MDKKELIKSARLSMSTPLMPTVVRSRFATAISYQFLKGLSPRRCRPAVEIIATRLSPAGGASTNEWREITKRPEIFERSEIRSNPIVAEGSRGMF
jgi:hypothetical protein